jgi:hypothetical protein
MYIPSISARAVSRRIVCARIVCTMTTATILAGIAGLIVALPATTDSARGAAFPMPDFDLAFAGVDAGSRQGMPVIAMAFDQVFASLTPQPDNTPPNREKLRNAGWRRVLQKS